MKTSFALATALLALGLAAPRAHATYLGLTIQLHTTVNIGGTDRSVWRVYTVFSNANDYLCAAAGSPQTGTMVIQSTDSLGNFPGGNFYQNSPGGNHAPTQSAIDADPLAEWDTFATMGMAIDDGTDDTSLSPGFPVFIAGNQLVSNNIAWFLPGPMEQARAGGPNSHPTTSLPGLGILLMQLTVNAGDKVRGTVSVGGVNSANPAAAFTANNQTFGGPGGYVEPPFVPGPGSIALIAFASLAMPWRKRRS